MQSSRELVDCLLRRRPAERMGLNDSPWGDTLREWVKQGYPTNDQGHPVDPVEHFGFDLAHAGGWFDAMPLRGCHEVVEETAEWRVVRNGAGALLKWWKDKSGTPEHVAFRMTSREVWERDYRPHLLALDRERVNVEGARQELARRRAQGKWAFYGHLFLWELMRASLGDHCMFETLATDPGWVLDYGRVYTDLFKMNYRLLFDEAGRPDGVWVYEDLGYSKGLYCSPRTLETLIFPYYKELVDFFHGYDLPVVLHSCGGVEQALPLIVAAGFDGLNPMQVKAGCDVLRFAQRYGDRLAFFGGFDAIVLESGDRPRIKREALRLLNGMKEVGARWVFGSDHSLSTNVRYADFQYLLEIYREHQRY